MERTGWRFRGDCVSFECGRRGCALRARWHIQSISRERCMNSLASLIRTIPDFPKPGIQFRDITTLLQNQWGFKAGHR